MSVYTRPDGTRVQRFGPCGGSGYTLVKLEDDRVAFCLPVWDYNYTPDNEARLALNVKEIWPLADLKKNLPKRRGDQLIDHIWESFDTHRVVKAIVPPRPHKIRIVGYDEATFDGTSVEINQMLFVNYLSTCRMPRCFLDIRSDAFKV